MKIEIHLDGPNARSWFASVLAAYNEAMEADREYYDARYNAEFGGATTGTAAAAPEPVTEEKPKATRGRKKAEEPAPQITTSPEDRKPVEEIEVAEVVEEAEVVDPFEEAPAPKVYTRDDVKAAMQVYVAKHGMDALAANASTLLGAPKLSAIPEDAAAFEAAVKRLEAASA